MRKILITGANGMLAKAVKKRFKEDELICTDVDELDITDAEAVNAFVSENRPDVVINCAAYTAVDMAEEKEAIAKKINCNGPKNLAIAAENNSAIFVHISTDYVFGGDLDVEKEYREDDEKHPQTAYGRTKLQGEQAITENNKSYYIFRTAWLYGKGNNFVETMLTLGEKNEEVKVVADQYGSPTYTVDLADIIYRSLEKHIPYGIYHATNIGFTSWCDFTKKIFEDAGISCRVIPVTSEEFPRPAKRPKNSKLSKGKIVRQGIVMPDWEDALERYLKDR